MKGKVCLFLKKLPMIRMVRKMELFLNYKDGMLVCYGLIYLNQL